MLGLLLRYLPEPLQRLAAPSGWGGTCRRVRKQRAQRKLKKKCPKLSLVIVAPLLNACVVESFSAVSGAASLGSAYFDYKTAKNSEPVLIKPPLATYDLDFMEQAADELELMRPPCARDVVTLNCSTITRMVLDYGELREKIKSLDKD